MNSQVALVAEKDEEQKYAVARKSAPNVVKGRRSFFEYVDLGVTDGSNGKMRVQKTSATNG